jgi:hypothetical protein
MRFAADLQIMAGVFVFLAQPQLTNGQPAVSCNDPAVVCEVAQVEVCMYVPAWQRCADAILVTAWQTDELSLSQLGYV